MKEMRNELDTNKYICMFDGTTTWAYICPECKEYKGLLTIAEAIKEQPWMIEAYHQMLEYVD